MGHKLSKISIFILITIGILGMFFYWRHLPLVRPAVRLPTVVKTSAVTLPWPNYGQSALGAADYGILAENGNQKSVPMASVTKIVTALAVLRQKPLTISQQGPVITFDKNDVAIFNKYYSQNGSVVRVVAGERISEYQALQAMLLPSANNMAESLARWAFGSQENYLTYANKMLAGLGLNQTYVADASGFSSKSVASAHDLVLLGETALSNPVLAQIVSQNQANVPVAGTIFSTNSQLGKNGVVGIKTGFTDEAGGCYLVATNQTVEGQRITFVEAILGAPDLKNAMSNSIAILAASSAGFQETTIVRAGQGIGVYKTPWEASSPIVANQDLSLLVWKGMNVKLQASLSSLEIPTQKDHQVGTISATSGGKMQKVPAVLKQSLSGPSWHWRLFRH